MKNISQYLLAGFFPICILIASCSSPFDQAIVDTISTENDSFNQKLIELQKRKQEISSEKNKKFEKLQNGIDPKKESAFKKDIAVQNGLKQTEDKYNKSISEFGLAIDEFSKAKEENDIFVSSLINRRTVGQVNSKDEKQALSDWANRSSKTQEIIDKAEHLKTEISQYLPEYNGIISGILKKYGKNSQEKSNKTMSKKKK